MASRRRNKSNSETGEGRTTCGDAADQALRLQHRSLLLIAAFQFLGEFTARPKEQPKKKVLVGKDLVVARGDVLEELRSELLVAATTEHRRRREILVTAVPGLVAIESEPVFEELG